jgi:hypothetical protein
VIKKFLINLKIDDKHPSEETLLKCADGELRPRQAARVRSHLETCWTCRAQLDKIEEAISLFVDFRGTIQVSLMGTPPSNWNGFNGKLAALAAEKDTKKTGRRSRLLSWQGFFDFSSKSRFSPLLVRAFAGTALAMLLIVGLVWQLTSIQKVSASELLERSIAAGTKHLWEIEKAVVYQKLHVQRQNEPGVNLEIWQDTTKQRFRQLVNYSDGDASQPEKTNRDVLRDLSEILRLNGMDPRTPLSAASFKTWRDSLTNRTDEVSRHESEGGSIFLSLQTVNHAATNAGQITQAVLKVRESDWHPFAETLRVKTSVGEETYELIESEFQLTSVSALSPDFFNEPTVPQVATMTTPLPVASASPSPSLSIESPLIPVTKPEDAPKIVATVDLEVEVLRLLNQAQADLGEQITVRREPDGLLYINGIVETPQRKSEVLSALETIRTSPAVMIEISTLAEAVAKEKNNAKQPEQVESVETQSTTIAAENDLIERLGSAQAARAFAAQTVNLSAGVMGRAYALRRLAGQFKPEELRQLSPDGRTKWLALIRQHAAAFQRESEKLRGKLKLAFDEPSASASAVTSVREINSASRAIEELFGFASANDRVVRSAMTTSAAGTQFTAIKTAQFWQSLRTAEALAAKLQAVK